MLLIQESFVNETRGYRFGETDWYEAWTDDRGQLFRACQREYGRCVSAMYVDRVDGPSVACGWVFQKRMEYEDAHRSRRGTERTYIREVWVALRDAPDADEE